MRRKSTFEDFEEMFRDDSSDSEDCGEKKELEFDPRIVRNVRRPRIPANGSELFEEQGETQSDFYDEDADEHEEMPKKHKKSRKEKLSAEERYRIREERLRKKAQKRRQSKHIGGKILTFIQLLLSIVLMAAFAMLNILPDKYLLVAGVILLFLFVFCFLLQFGRRVHWFGKILSLILIGVLIFGNIYLAKTMGTLDVVTKVKTYQTDKIVIAVMADNPAQSVEDAKDYQFGIMSGLDRAKVDQAIEHISEGLNQELDISEYTTYSELVQHLYDGKIDAMIYNQTLDELIEDNNPGFIEKVRIIDNFEVKTEVLMKDVPDLPITKEPFIVFLSGMDAYGTLDQTCRSDVNIMACVNPTTKQVLLVSVPRDAYVEIPGITYGESDKLTHAGMYGIQYSIATMEQIFDIDIDYYVRVNFSAVIQMVDALGGIDVESDYAFSTYYKQYNADTDTWSYYEYKKGLNHLDGIYALAFARERMNAAGGDYQRAKNQQKVIAALLEKIKSPAVLTGYTNLLSSLEGTMDTSFSSQQLASLVKMQLNDNAEWNIVSSTVHGYSSQEYCASYADSPLYVEVLDDDSILAVKEVIDKLMAGEVISEPRVTDLQQIYEVDESDLEGDYYVNNHADDDEYDDFYWEHGGYLDESDYETFVHSETEEDYYE